MGGIGEEKGGYRVLGAIFFEISEDLLTKHNNMVYKYL
jgi:hypothetical protein